MSTLQCRLFRDADEQTFGLLENCANGVPNEVASHLTIGSAGEHVSLVQIALSFIAESRPDLGVLPFEPTSLYGQEFADAVARYKTSKGILNFAGLIDNIVGRKTIASIDADMLVLEQPAPPEPEPPVPPPPDPEPQPGPVEPCLAADNCPFSRRFGITLLGSLTGGEVLETGAFFFDIHDEDSGLTTRYLGEVLGLATPSPIPFSVSVLGKKTLFNTADECRVTDFVSFAISAATLPPPVLLSLAGISLTFRGRQGIAQTLPFSIDTGPVSLPGAAVHIGELKNVTSCGGIPGARRES